MAKAKKSRFPDPPKPSFPVEIVPPGSGNFGGDDQKTSFGDFRIVFLRLMQEAGEKLGQAAAGEISKARITVNGGGGGGSTPGVPLSGRNQYSFGTPDYFLHQFNKLAAPGNPLQQLTSLFAPFLVGRFAISAANLPAHAEAQAESMRKYSTMSPSMAQAFAQYDVQNLLRDMRLGEQKSDTTRDLLKAQNEYKNKVEGPLGIVWDNLWNRINTGILQWLTSTLGPEIAKHFPEATLSDDVGNPWLERMERIAMGQKKAEERDKVLNSLPPLFIKPMAPDPRVAPPPETDATVGGLASDLLGAIYDPANAKWW